MKIIVSHDVDHIDTRDHLAKDLILEKMFIRSFIQFFRREISTKTFFYRISMAFRGRMNRIEEVMKYDQEHHIPSTFFFGMSSALGMSYSKKKAKKYIELVEAEGFDTGVHGCEYIRQKLMRKEFESFAELSGKGTFGIRNHYVRYDDNTFEKMEKTGYLFDSTRFNKAEIELLKPYKVGEMWEFPLHIMDVYICKQGQLQQGIKKTHGIIDEAERSGLNFLTILFHDYQYDDVFDPQLKKWYEDTIQYCENKGFGFVSYRDAIREMEIENN